MLEWNITCDDWKWDEVDHRPCEKRCKLNASLGASAYYENDDDAKRDQWGGLAVRGSSARGADRMGLNAWFRAQYNGWSSMVEWYQRDIDYTRHQRRSLTQTDSGAHAYVHYRFADSNWGVGVRAGMVWLDDDYLHGHARTPTTIDIEDTITEFGVGRELLLPRPQQQGLARRELRPGQLGRQLEQRRLPGQQLGQGRDRGGRDHGPPPVAAELLGA